VQGCGGLTVQNPWPAFLIRGFDMPRPWTSDDDLMLRAMYRQSDMPIQAIRNTLHRSAEDIHKRAHLLGLARSKNEVRLTNRAKATSLRGFLTGRLGHAVMTLRRRGYTPVHAQRSSEMSADETGLWVVGRKVLTVDEVITLAERY
jgi:hypothetical protein